jgi:hypothetical protein
MIEVAYALVNIFKNIGVPLIIHTDNGKEFASLANGAKHIHISDSDTNETCGQVPSWSRDGHDTASPRAALSGPTV